MCISPPQQAGFYKVGLAGGVETMSSNPMAWEGGVNPRIKQVPQAASCLMPMGVTSENVAEKFGVDRKTQASRHCLTYLSHIPIRSKVILPTATTYPGVSPICFIPEFVSLRVTPF